MSFTFLALVVISEICSIAGQLFLKHAINQHDGGTSRFRSVPAFASGIGAMALGFFLWTGLLSQFDLSYLYPFEGLDRILLVMGAAIFLKEKMTLNLWLGVLLISGGAVLVSFSGPVPAR